MIVSKKISRYLSIVCLAFTERVKLLVTTIIIEIPVFMIIWEGHAKLCRVAGRSNFLLIMSILPLSVILSRINGMYYLKLVIMIHCISY
jgi:hypothetical protein